MIITQRYIVHFLLSLLLFSCAGERVYLHSGLGPDEDRIVENIVTAHGGRARLKEISSVTAEGRIGRYLAKDEGSYSRVLQRPGRLRVDITYPGSRELRILNGEKGYRGAEGRPTEVTGAQLLSMVYQYDALDLPFGFVDGTLDIAGLVRNGSAGPDTYGITCWDRAGNRMDVVVDSRSNRITRSSATFAIGGAETTLSAEFGDYRMVDGVLLPFRITNYAGGMRISETIITRYELNAKLPETLFAP